MQRSALLIYIRYLVGSIGKKQLNTDVGSYLAYS